MMKRRLTGFVCCISVLFSTSIFSQVVKKGVNISKDKTVNLFLAGDVMTGRGIDQALSHSVNPILYESYVKDARGYLQLAERKNGNIDTPVSYNYIWGDAIKIWKMYDPDLKLVNLETSITTNGEPWPGKGIHYRMHPENVELLSTVEIDHVSLANNHILDWGRPGLKETLQVLKNAQIDYSGAGKNKNHAQAPSIYKKDSVRILVFSYGTGNSGVPLAWASEDTQAGVNYLRGFGMEEVKGIKANIQSYKKAGDIVIFSIHWGGNWGYEIPNNHQSFAHDLIDQAGIDLIFGHSSHHPLGMEVYKEKLIIYGAGDFINDYEGISGHEQYKPNLSLMYFPKIDLNNGNLLSLKLIPMQIRKFSLHRANTSQAKWLADVLNREGEKFGTGIKRKETNLVLDW